MQQDQEMSLSSIVHKWKGTFIDAEQERLYQEDIWATSVRKYFILTVTIVVIELPELISRGEEMYLQFAMQLCIATIPILLRNQEFFRKRHDYICGGVIAALQGVGIGSLMHNPPDLKGPEEIIPMLMIPLVVPIVIAGVLPFGLIAATIFTVVLCINHFIATWFMVSQVFPVHHTSVFLTNLLCCAFIIAVTLIRLRESEIGKRMQFHQFRLLFQKKATIENTFKSYMGGAVGESILADDIVLSGEDRWVTIIFTDLRGYSTIIEPMSPKQVLNLLNDYFSEMGDIIRKYDGVVFEYIGDAMMIVFGAPNDVEHHQSKAVQCAVEMRSHLETLNKRWEEEGIAHFWQNQDIEKLTARVGIHAGNIVAGNIGGRDKLKYGAIGDVVNIAARLEQANKQLGTNILMSRSVYVSLPKNINCDATDHGMIDIKGRTQQQHVYSM